MKKNITIIIGTVGVIGLLILLAVLGFREYKKSPIIGGGLKTAPANIIAYKDLKDKDGNDIVQYFYKGDEKGAEKDEIVEKRTPNQQVFKWRKDGRPTIKAFIGPQFFEENGKWFVIQSTTTLKSIFDTEYTVKRDWSDLWADPVWATTLNTSTVALGSGRIWYNSAVSWADARSQANGNSLLNDGSNTYCGSIWINPNRYVSRCYFPVYISIPAGATYTSSSLHLQNSGILSGTPMYGLYLSNQSSATNLVVGDYNINNWGTAEGTAARMSPVANVWTTFLMGASTSTAWLPAGGSPDYVKFGIRNDWDVDDTLSDVSSNVEFFFYAAAVSANRPYFLADYDEAAPAAGGSVESDIIFFE